MVTARLADALVEIADTLGDDFDTSTFLRTLTDRSVEVMDITAAGVLLADDHGAIRRSSASSHEALALQQWQVQTEHGPAMDCLRTGQSVSADNLRADVRWPQFAVRAAAAGFAAVHTVAMRRRAQTVGALSFFTTRSGPLDPNSLNTGRALSEIAAIGLLQRDGIRAGEVRVGQLQTALDGRILIEQAKGILSERLGLSVSDVFSLLRHHARNRNRSLRDVARGVVDGTGQLTLLTTGQLTSLRSAGKPDSKRPSLPSPLVMPGKTRRQPSDTPDLNHSD